MQVSQIMQGRLVRYGATTVLLIAAWLPAMNVAAQSAATPAPMQTSVQKSDEVLPEMLVKGTRLYQMRKAIVEAEDRFYALYNELNKNNDYDVHCKIEAPIGTKLKERVCRAQFIERAQENEAVAVLAEIRGEAAGFALSPDLVALEREEDFSKSMLDVINSDPRLRRLIRERDAIEKKYESERKKRMKGKLILVE
jgi:hypothetical protein